MVHTLPPWSTKYRLIKLFANVDNSELAARLGSPNIFERRGNVIFMDSFEQPVLQWDVIGDATSPIVELNTARAHSRDQAVKINPVNVSGKYAGIEKYMPLRYATKIGIEWAFTRPTTKGIIEFIGYIYTGSRLITVGFRTKKALTTEYSKYYDSSGNWVELEAGKGLGGGSAVWHILKMSIDVANEKYNYILIDDREYSLGVSTKAADDTEDAIIFLQTFATSEGANQPEFYVDDCIVTQEDY